MTVGEYVKKKFGAWNVTEASLVDLAAYVSPDDEYCLEDNGEAVANAMVSMLAELILSPHMSQVNENGFSVSWDYSGMGRYYIWLCRKYGIAPDDEVVEAADLSTIKDMSDTW